MAYTGQLNTNEVFASLFNMIISLQVFPTGISDLSGIYEKRKVDGTLYGDTKLYTSTDALKSYPWDGTDTPGDYNLLTIKRPPLPKKDAIVIDEFRQIPVTVDEYLTKRAFMDEGTFGSFNGVVLSWLQTTKDVYEHTTYTANMLISAETKAKALASIDLSPDGSGATLAGYDLLIWKAQELYRQIEDAMKELNEPSRSYNDHGFLRNYKLDDFDIIVPLGVLSSVRKHDVPFLYNADEKPIFKEVHWKYFGAINASGATLTGTNTTVRALVEKDYVVSEVTTHVFPGDLLPNLATYLANETYTATYTERPSISDDITILAIHKQDYPIMSAFTVGTSFFNARRLDMNHYLTFGHNDVYDAHLGERALLKLATLNT